MYSDVTTWLKNVKIHEGYFSFSQSNTRRLLLTFHNRIRFYGEELLAPRSNTPSWRTTPCLLSATAYSIYSQLSLGYPGVDGRITLGWIFRKWDVVVWTGSRWLRIGTGGGQGPARKLSSNLYKIYQCQVYSEWTPDDGQRTCPKHAEVHFFNQNKFGKLVHLLVLL